MERPNDRQLGSQRPEKGGHIQPARDPVKIYYLGRVGKKGDWRFTRPTGAGEDIVAGFVQAVAHSQPEVLLDSKQIIGRRTFSRGEIRKTVPFVKVEPAIHPALQQSAMEPLGSDARSTESFGREVSNHWGSIHVWRMLHS